MKIQIISNNSKKIQSDYNITNSTLKAPLALDMFDINVFSLQTESIWLYSKDMPNQLDCSNDFKSIKQMIASSTKAINIIALPQNYTHSWNYYSHQYNASRLLKDEITNLKNNLLEALISENYITRFNLIYENSITTIKDSTFKSAFCFIDCTNDVTRSDGANKITTIRLDRFILTTLDLQSDGAKFDDFIKGIGLDNQRSDIPQWLVDYRCFDDAQQQELIYKSSREIEDLNDKIRRANEKLEENLKYKSILSTNGDELVSVVFEILEKTLSCDLSGFVDEGKQDFLIKKENVTFIGEIKGITSNVKSENVSQLDVHYQSYLDDLQEKGISEKVKQLLIINPFRTKPIGEREEVHEIQINLAKRNESLIITTETLLKIFEQFINNKLSSEKIISVFITKTGLLTLDAFCEDSKKVDNSVYKV